jgi:ligand-binding SRPBCC domain-containing protein
MKLYTLKRTQILPVTLTQAWNFFATPDNLARITPPHLKFIIRYSSGNGPMYAGQIIGYRLYPVSFWCVNWVTEITHVQQPFYFVDEQRSGPYALWHHEHRFRETAAGTEMIDELAYAIPFGMIGRLAHALFVKRMLNRIFDYRYHVLQQHFDPASRETGLKL